MAMFDTLKGVSAEFKAAVKAAAEVFAAAQAAAISTYLAGECIPLETRAAAQAAVKAAETLVGTEAAAAAAVMACPYHLTVVSGGYKASPIIRGVGRMCVEVKPI